MREIGKGLYGIGYSHSVRFDKYDNMWVVDKGTNMIMKFNQMGHVTMVLGRKEEAPDEHHYRQTQVIRRRATSITISISPPTSRGTRRTTSI